MRIKYIIAIIMVVMSMGSKCAGTSGNEPLSTDLPVGQVTKVTKDTGTTYEICVRAAYDDRGFKKGEVTCRGARSSEEARLCPVGANYPECKN